MEPKEIEICVRKANSNDRQKVLEFKQMYPFNYFHSYFPKTKSKILDMLFGRKYSLYLCEMNGEIIGCKGVVKHSLYKDIFYADDMFMMPQFRGAGIGKKLYSRYYELVSNGKIVKFFTRVESENIAPQRILRALGNKPFQFMIFYTKYRQFGGVSSNYEIGPLFFRSLKSQIIKRLYHVFSEVVGGDYFSVFNKTNKLNFLFPNQNYREIIAFLIKRISGIIKYRILLITDRDEIIGYALNGGNQNQIYLAPSVVNNQAIINCNQALYDYLRPNDWIENYYYLHSETVSELNYDQGHTRKIYVLYNVINRTKN